MSSKNEPGVYFNKLNDQEKQSKISNLLNMARSEVTVWVKGADNKFNLEIEGPLSDDFEVRILSKVSLDLLDSDLLLNFNLSGLNFFAQAKIIFKNEINYLSFSGDFFKSERRANFRLLTYPHHEVFLYIRQEPATDENKANVVDIKTKTSETGLFRNFLNIVSGTKDELISAGYLKLRALDISVSGTALKVGELEREIVAQNMEDLGRLILDFNGELFEIPGGKIHYIFPMKTQSGTVPVFKAGVEFTGIDTNLDESLSALINQTLRSVDKEFEDFLK